MRTLPDALIVVWLAAATLAPIVASAARAGEPTYFRRDQGLAVGEERHLPEDLDPAHGVWRQSLPPGHSTPTIALDRIFLTAHDGNDLITLCLDLTSGQELWRQSLHVDALEKFHREGSPAAASVACQDGRVFAFFGSYGLACYDVDGKLLWSKRLGPFHDEFGAASSPILIDDKVILCEDHDLDSYLLAVRQTDGQTVWQTPREGFTRSYSTPVVWNAGGRRQLVVAGSLQLAAYDPDDGRQLWARDGFARIVNTTPAVAGDMLYVATWSPGGDTDARIAMEPWDVALAMWDGDKNGKLESAELPAGEVQSRFYRIDLDNDQALDQREWDKYAEIFERAQNTMVALRADAQDGPPEVVWEYHRGLPYVASPLVYRGRVVLVKDGGIVTVLDAADGKLVTQARARGAGNYYASPVAGDGKIYLSSEGGSITVFRPGKRLDVISSHDFGELIAATPVIADGRIYVRTAKALYCFASL